MKARPIILIFAGVYLPGYRAGGPVRTIANLVECLGDEFDFRIVCADRDFRSQHAYSDVKVDAWNGIGKAQVFYASKRWRSLRGLRRILRDTPHDVLYLNSFFASEFTIRPLFLRTLRLVPRRPLLIAPRGEFSPGALAIKPLKKSAFIALARVSGLYAAARWQVSTALEASELQRRLAVPQEAIREARNLVAGLPGVEVPSSISTGTEASGNGTCALRVCFLSRISSKKNLDFALCTLACVRIPVDFAIYGPIEEAAFWRHCQSLIEALPPHISVRYFGEVNPESVRQTIAGHDVFFVPTRGENFGHVFVEAWASGVPVLVSDQTPWRELQDKGIGWDLPLSDIAPFARVLESIAQRKPTLVEAMRRNCLVFARKQIEAPEIVEANRQLFLEAIALDSCVLASS